MFLGSKGRAREVKVCRLTKVPILNPAEEQLAVRSTQDEERDKVKAKFPL